MIGNNDYVCCSSTISKLLLSFWFFCTGFRAFLPRFLALASFELGLNACLWRPFLPHVYQSVSAHEEWVACDREDGANTHGHISYLSFAWTQGVTRYLLSPWHVSWPHSSPADQKYFACPCLIFPPCLETSLSSLCFGKTRCAPQLAVLQNYLSDTFLLGYILRWYRKSINCSQGLSGSFRVCSYKTFLQATCHMTPPAPLFLSFHLSFRASLVISVCQM